MSEMNPLSFFEEDVTEEINHGIRVSNLAYCVAKELGLYEEQCHELALAGMMHDIGKLYVSGYLYGRDKDTLKIEEMKYVRLHPRLGYDELMRLDFSDFVLESILYHHENYDGSGYPENLAGGQKTFENGHITYCEAHHNMAIFYAQSADPVLSVDVIPIGMVTSDLVVFKELPGSVEVTFALAE